MRLRNYIYIYLEVINPIVKLEIVGDGAVSLIRCSPMYGVTSEVTDLQTHKQIHKEIS